MRLVFLGSPAFALPSLEAVRAAGHDIALVVTQPDRPAGRGQKPTPPPVAAYARQHGLPLWQTPSLKGPEAEARLREVGAEAMALAAFAALVPGNLLELTPGGILNVHPSLLPRWRGAAPIQSALLAGDHGNGRQHHSPGPGARRWPDPAAGARADRARRRLRVARAAAGGARRAAAGARAGEQPEPRPRTKRARRSRAASSATMRASTGRSRTRRSGTRCAPTAAGRRRSPPSTAALKVLAGPALFDGVARARAWFRSSTVAPAGRHGRRPAAPRRSPAGGQARRSLARSSCAVTRACSGAKLA